MQTQIRPGGFFSQNYKCAGQIPIQMQENKRAGGFFLKNNKRADQNKAMQRGNFFSKLINVHARLFDTLEYVDIDLCRSFQAGIFPLSLKILEPKFVFILSSWTR